MIYDDVTIALIRAILLAFCCALAGRCLFEMLRTPDALLGWIPLWIENGLSSDHKLYKFITCKHCLSGWTALLMWPLLTFDLFPLTWGLCGLMTVGVSLVMESSSKA